MVDLSRFAGKKVELRGILREAHQGFVLEIDGRIVYFEGKKPQKALRKKKIEAGTEVVVNGTLVVDQGLSPKVFEGDIKVHGISGATYRIQGAKVK